jgi:spore germination protein GerM
VKVQVLPFVASALLGLLCASVAGGGAVSAESSRERTTVYFLIDGGSAPIGVRREIERRSPFAREALKALLAGPTAQERSVGISTSIPRTARLRSLRIAPSLSGESGLAVVDLSGFVIAREPDAERVATQIARTTIGLSGIEKVRVHVNGRPIFFNLRGQPLDLAIGYRTLMGWHRECSARSHACFSALP